ncbi:MAG: HAD family hydrolase [Deltaproteobacteria bacterium]|nr:HAD family hydrolase [Deltaproteobacteria bacterium]
MINRNSIDVEFFRQYIKPLKPITTHLSAKGSDAEDIRAIVFDIYGTMFISGSGDIGSGDNGVVKNDSIKTTGLEKLMKKFFITGSADSLLNGLSSKIKKTHEKLKNQGIDFPEVNIDRIWMELLDIDEVESARAFAIEFELIVNPVYPMPHLKQLIDALRTKNVCMGIVSNAQFFTPYLFEWFLGKRPVELGFHSELILYSYQYDCAKPSRFLFKLAADKLTSMGIPVGSALYIGNDMLNDIYAAGNEGFLTALFAGDKRSLRMRKDDMRCQNIEPDFIVTDLIQILDFLRSHHI